MLPRFHTIPLCCLLLAAWAGHLPLASAQVLPIRHYVVADGLISNAVNSLYQDSRGIVWIGTGDGLSSFDGTAFRNYADAEGLDFTYVNSVSESSRDPGVLWVATNGGGLYRLQGKTFANIRLGLGPSVDRVNAVYEALDGSLWCGTDGGLVRYRSGSPELFWPYREIGEVNDICPVDDSTFWCLGPTEIRVVTRGGDVITRIASPVREPDLLTRAYKDRDGDLWIGTSQGTLLRFHGTQLIEQLHPGPGVIIPGIDDGQGLLWVGHDNGIAKIPKLRGTARKITQLSRTNGLPAGPVRSMLRDRENIFWFGVHLSGLAKLEDRTMTHFPLADMKRSMAVVGNGIDRSWAVGRSGLTELYRAGDGAYRTAFHPRRDGVRDDDELAIARDTAGDLWTISRTGTLRGIRVEGQPGHASELRLHTSVTIPGIDPIFTPLALCATRDGRLWVSINKLGTYHIDPGTTPPRVQLFTADDGVPDNGVRTLYEDPGGRVWFGGYSRGATSADPPTTVGNAVLNAARVDSLPDGSVRAFLKTSGGELVIGTRYAGLWYQSRTSHAMISTRDGLPGNAVICLAEAPDQRIYVGTTRGLARISPGDSVRVERLEETLGLSVFGVGFFAGGDLWMLTGRGFTVIDMASRRRDVMPPPVFVTRIEVNGREIPLTPDLELPHDWNNISIEYLGISFRGEQPITYQVRLDGVDEEWHEQTPLRAVTYGTLNPGAYTFNVRAFNKDGIASLAPARWSFVILPPFWLRWWFVTGALLFTIGLAFLLIRMRVSRLLEIERIRSRLAIDLHDDIGASLTRITIHADAVRREMESSRDSSHATRAMGHLADIGTISRSLVDDMSDVVWSIDPRNDTFDDLLLRMKTTASRVLEANGVEYDIDIPEGISALGLPPDFRRHFFLIFKESLNNVLRHSGARSVRIAVGREDGWLTLIVSDDGRGFVPPTGGGGNGLRNIHRRAGLLNGDVRIDSAPGAGTTVRLMAQLP